MLANNTFTIETRWKENNEFRVRFDVKNANSVSLTWFDSLKESFSQDAK